MCVTRVAKVVSIAGDRAVVRLPDGRRVNDNDVSMVHVKRGGYVEVFADQALSTLTEEEAALRSELWKELAKRLESRPTASVRKS